MSDRRELSREETHLASPAISQRISRVPAPAAPRVASRVIARTAIIHDEQRSPSEDELSSIASSAAEPSRLGDIGPLMPVLQAYLTQPNCRTSFALEQQLWTHLAGNNTRYWANSSGSQEEDDRPLYAPLDENRREIRVLKVLRPFQGGHGGIDTVQADLVCVSLDDDPSYLAISYVWGDPSIVGYFESHQEGQERRVPYNKGVFDIISTILERDTTLYFWIDALCINQENLNERASQVALMGTIFSRARQVVAFIGQADETSTTAMEFILRTANCIWANGSLSDFATVPGMASLLSGIGPVDPDWESINDLNSRPWFHRLWIVQEIALGNDPVVVCGKHTFPWCALTLFIDFTGMVQKYPAIDRVRRSSRDAFSTTMRRLPNTRAILHARRGQMDDWLKTPFLYSLFSLNGDFNSTDPRDRVYALLGLATAKKYRDALRPDYGIKVEDLFVKLARQMLIESESILFLHMAGIGHRRSLNLPSWVPDWTSLPRIVIQNMNVSGPVGHKGDTEVFRPRFSFDPTSPLVLTLYGRIHDSISSIIRDPYPELPTSREQPYYRAVPAYMDAVMELVFATCPESVGKPPNECPWTKPLMETLTASGSPLGEYWTHCQWVVDDMGTIRTPAVTEAGFAEFLERCCRWSRDRYVIPDKSVEESDFTGLFFKVAIGRRFYISAARHFGLATEGARAGDRVCMFEGHRVPFVVRPVDEADMSKGAHLVGEAVSNCSVYCALCARMWSYFNWHLAAYLGIFRSRLARLATGG